MPIFLFIGPNYFSKFVRQLYNGEVSNTPDFEVIPVMTPAGFQLVKTVESEIEAQESDKNQISLGSSPGENEATPARLMDPALTPVTTSY